MQRVEDALSCDRKPILGDSEYDALIMDLPNELKSLVNHPIDYAQVVKKIGNAMDMTLVDLEGLLPSAVIMVVSVTTPTTSGKPLPQDVGSIYCWWSVVPADCIKLVGAKRNTNNLAGSKFHHIGGCYIEQTQTYGLLADKCILASRMDSARGDPTGQYGTSLRYIILKKMEKLQEQKLVNRIKFGVAEESSLGQGYGMLSQAAGIRLSAVYSGLTSSLAFTPVQGIELSNPHQAKHTTTSHSTYFSETATFSKIKTT
ncbi:hypothetical protein R3W88_033907 [Solanum pinnatisectum]|uniref:Nop domain-containing protein n=1 Tax=Solanum pinnatisectum TaxID=50273 RepID=A0AAV9JZV8_9SOLN|nr:hypothetical protein R3W88_033907 [Solanum pinnatisectum]